MTHQPYAGIYWTRPVPRIGFVALSADTDTAAGQSLTIRYQRDLARRYVRSEHGRMIDEIALLELAPDRATREGVAAVARFVERVPADTIFLAVDFASVMNWRPHRFLWSALPSERTHTLPPDPLPIDGALFDPVRHFRTWQAKDEGHQSGKQDHRARVYAALEEVRERSFAQKAQHLNRLGLHTHGGRVWTADNLRKFMK